MQPTVRDPNPPLTRSVEDYLKVIYHLSSQGGFAATSDIAAMLEVSSPSVSGMVKRLSETGLIEHVPYRGVQLTPQGRRAALRMIRRHRILELYLTQHLGYGWGGTWRGSCGVRRSARERAKGESLMAAPQADLPLPSPEPGWRRPRLAPSLAEVYRTVPVSTGAWWRKALAFAGPGYLVAVGYMDPGNWATDLAGGSRFGYALLSVILLSNLMAILLQGLAAKLGIVTGRDLAQACRDHYSRPTALALWVLCEVAIAACDLAEVIGSAIGLNLLFGIPLPWGIAITALDVLIVLFLQNKGFRLLEALVVALIATIAGCFLFEIFISRPDLGAVAGGFVPRASILADPHKLYIAIGILGATVMPHNLYLHSSVVQTRAYEETTAGKRMAVKYAFIDSTLALSFALFINAKLKARVESIVAAATFHRAGDRKSTRLNSSH